MKDLRVFWGDFHTHYRDEDVEQSDKIMHYAKGNIDFYALMVYPFYGDYSKKTRIESVQESHRFEKVWEAFQELCRDNYDPGSFVTFLGYEWNGNRTRYGDHNVIYFDENNPLDDTWKLEDLYKNLRKRKAIAIPHHTAYLKNHRGKNWDVIDEDISPIMEIYSKHGSSEGYNTPLPLGSNVSMGPGTAGGTFHDALAKGLKIGVIGSNDGAYLPGQWNFGRAAVWAPECTRESIWNAVKARKTYAVTGDRIILDFNIEGSPMGSVIKGGTTIDAEVDIEASDAIDRIELLQNGRVVDTYFHNGKWEESDISKGKYKIQIKAGWGPAERFNFKICDEHWNLNLDVEKGQIMDIEKCFSIMGQEVNSLNKDSCSWKLITAGRKKSNNIEYLSQGIIFEIEGNKQTKLVLSGEGITIKKTIGDLLKGPYLEPLLNEAKKRVLDYFGVGEQHIYNPDTYYANSRKIKLFQAVPQAGYKVSHVFKNVKLKGGQNNFYIRVSQNNGQMAWSSPIWVDSE